MVSSSLRLLMLSYVLSVLCVSSVWAGAGDGRLDSFYQTRKGVSMVDGHVHLAHLVSSPLEHIVMELATRPHRFKPVLSADSSASHMNIGAG